MTKRHIHYTDKKTTTNVIKYLKIEIIKIEIVADLFVYRISVGRMVNILRLCMQIYTVFANSSRIVQMAQIQFAFRPQLLGLIIIDC